LADTFKNAGVDLTTTDPTTLYTVPTAAPGVTGTPPIFPTTAVIKSIVVCNDSGSATEYTIEWTDTSATATYKITNDKTIATDTTYEVLSQPLVLEESDLIKITANAANQIHITLSLLEITKGDL
jgi:hypothetical protein|tara:strand:+ start:3590 stop:3964 length:375 start_codon:yes stop_codon:yes gene_type:complete